MGGCGRQCAPSWKVGALQSGPAGPLACPTSSLVWPVLFFPRLLTVKQGGINTDVEGRGGEPRRTGVGGRSGEKIQQLQEKGRVVRLRARGQGWEA